MNCKNCGNPLTNEDKFCKNCGTPVENVESNQNEPMQSTFVNNTQQPDNSVNVGVQNEYTSSIKSSPVSENNNNNNKKTIIIIVVAILLIAAIGGGIFIMTNNNSSSNETTSSKKKDKEKNNTEEKENEEDAGEKGNTTSNDNGSSGTTIVHLNDFKVEVPGNYDVDVDENDLYIMNDEKWVLDMQIHDGSFEEFLKEKIMIKEMYEIFEYGVEVRDDNVNGVDIVVYELEEDGEHHIEVYARLTNEQLIYFNAFNQDFDSSSDEEIINVATQIIKNVKQKKKINGIVANRPSTKLDIDKVFEDLDI